MDARGIHVRLGANVRRLRRRLAAVLVVAAVFAPAPAKALSINIDAPGLVGSEALAAFERAANAWERVFSDPVEVNISADLLPLGSPTVLGQTSSVLLEGDYDLVRDAMVLDGLSESDDGVVAYLPTSGQFTATVLGTPFGAFGLNGGLSATKANLKALRFDLLGIDLDGLFGARDATIEFNSAFQFDFDRSDGVTPGLTDFETVAAHEIGHVLGFDSVVDTVENLLFSGIITDVAPRTLDLFRFEVGNEPTNPNEFTSAARLLVPGFVDPLTFDDVYAAVFSDLDISYRLSTGFFLGDGRQASHWKDDNLTGIHIGLMDPSLARAQIFDITPADIRALDLIGWDYEPAVAEPPSGVLLALALLALLIACRRRAPARQRGF